MYALLKQEVLNSALKSQGVCHMGYIVDPLKTLNSGLGNLNFHPLEVVSRYRDPQLQVGDKYSYFLSYFVHLFLSYFRISGVSFTPNFMDGATIKITRWKSYYISLYCWWDTTSKCYIYCITIIRLCLYNWFIEPSDRMLE